MTFPLIVRGLSDDRRPVGNLGLKSFVGEAAMR
jgi:hypothetical protein